jgi:hypothetical protein
MSTQTVSDDAVTQPTALQAKSGLAMPITRIKTDVKKLSGCDQMATDATVTLAAVVEYFVEEITRRAHSNRRKGQTSIASEVVEDVVRSDPDFTELLGENFVFMHRAKKVRSAPRKPEEEEGAKPKRAKKEKVEGEKPKRAKKEKVAEKKTESSEEDE